MPGKSVLCHPHQSPRQRAAAPAPPGQAAWREAMAMCLALAVILLIIKARLLPFEAATVGELVRWLARLAVVSADDLLLVGILAGICGLATAALRRWPKLIAMWRGLQFAIFLGMAAYSVFAMALFRVTMQPFNIRTMTLVEGPLTMLDSIKRYLTWYWVRALFAAPLAVALAPRLLRRVWWFRRGAPLGWKAVVVLTTLLAGYAAASHYYVKTHWNEPM